jgi:phage-related protein
MGSSLKDVRSFPEPVRKDIGRALLAAQMGGVDPASKPLRGFGGASVMEIVVPFRSDAYRAVYTVQLENAVYVLHAFQKKSKRGVATPQPDMDLIRKRLADARAEDARKLP